MTPKLKLHQMQTLLITEYILPHSLPPLPREEGHRLHPPSHTMLSSGGEDTLQLRTQCGQRSLRWHTCAAHAGRLPSSRVCQATGAPLPSNILCQTSTAGCHVSFPVILMNLIIVFLDKGSRVCVHVTARNSLQPLTYSSPLGIFFLNQYAFLSLSSSYLKFLLYFCVQ